MDEINSGILNKQTEKLNEITQNTVNVVFVRLFY